ncbi:hypothetical protein [Pseudomonas sp. dw_358]|uniref:hypothetical protein n=1 Tax=Pseudomonas sp. dw_358 TaxID=2720083 RepID=UPI001BD30CA0|nr:hypothetical protein [Pseudomonas sp. dw_358]
MKPLLVLGPDSTLRNVFALAQQAWPQRRIQSLVIPAKQYYLFDLSVLDAYSPNDWEVCVAVNEFYVNDVRRALQEAVAARGFSNASVISPRADIDASAVIGSNAVIYAGCVIGPNVVLGQQCVLRANVVLAEDVVLGDYVTLEANVALRELASVGSFTTVCANSSLMRQAKVGKHCYLNIQRQYSGEIADMTWFSPAFQNPVRVIGQV